MTNRLGNPVVLEPLKDKLMACLLWGKTRDKSDPDYVKAPHYFDAILAWHDRLSINDAERCATVHEVCIRPGWSEHVAETYAAPLPAVPPFPAVPAGSG